VQKQEIEEQWQPIPITNSYPEVFFENNYHYTFSISGIDTSRYTLFKISAVDKNGTPTFPLYINYYPTNLRDPKTNDGNILTIRGNWLQWFVNVNSLKHLHYFGALEKKIPELFRFPRDENHMLIQVPLAVALENKQILESFFETAYPVFDIIERQTDIKLYSPDRRFSAHFPPTALYNRVIVQIKANVDSQGLYPVPHLYQTIGKVYDLQPFDEPVDSGVWISLKAPEDTPFPDGLGLYYWDPKKGWLFIPSSIDSAINSYSAKITSLEKFVLIQDTIPPTLYPITSSRGAVLNRAGSPFRFHLKDEMSGIYKESQIQAALNGKWHLCEYDPEEDSIIIDIPPTTEAGSELKIEVLDNVGNKTIRKYILN
jgi:hypothetical protein